MQAGERYLLRNAVTDSIEITKNEHGRLKKYNNLNWLPGFIFEGAGDVPEGLSAHLVSSWLSKGSTKACREHLEWVFARCEELAKDASRK